MRSYLLEIAVERCSLDALGWTSRSQGRSRWSHDSKKLQPMQQATSAKHHHISLTRLQSLFRRGHEWKDTKTSERRSPQYLSRPGSRWRALIELANESRASFVVAGPPFECFLGKCAQEDLLRVRVGVVVRFGSALLHGLYDRYVYCMYVATS
jgi:hypothetical protein